LLFKVILLTIVNKTATQKPLDSRLRGNDEGGKEGENHIKICVVSEQMSEHAERAIMDLLSTAYVQSQSPGVNPKKKGVNSERAERQHPGGQRPSHGLDSRFRGNDGTG